MSVRATRVLQGQVKNVENPGVKATPRAPTPLRSAQFPSCGCEPNLILKRPGRVMFFRDESRRYDRFYFLRK